MYFNLKIIFKVNMAASYAELDVAVIFFRKKHFYCMKVVYTDFIGKILHRYRRTKSVEKVKSHFDYLYYVRKYGRKAMKRFIVKNILFYPECLGNSSTLAIEFVVVNNILKKSLLNG
ncbi:MAG: hypothetical protein AAGU76_01765 [Sedimentibacter sp.]|uniref:hypothetical protein n=1 Tax=Sedimentibacter sp. TaxID=1960295 RepID=UPI003158D650